MLSAFDATLHTPLHTAASEGSDQVARVLIGHKADVGMVTAEGDNPLQLAARAGHESTARVILR